MDMFDPNEDDEDSDRPFCCRFCGVLAPSLLILENHLLWCAEFLWTSVVWSLPFDQGPLVLTNRICRFCKRTGCRACARGVFEWAYSRGVLPPALSRCWGPEHLAVIIIHGNGSDWIPDLTAYGDVERNPGPGEWRVVPRWTITLSVWVRDLAGDGDVEENPGPPKSAAAIRRTFRNKPRVSKRTGPAANSDSDEFSDGAEIMEVDLS